MMGSFANYNGFNMQFSILFDVSNHHDLLEKVKKTDSTDLHIRSHNETM